MKYIYWYALLIIFCCTVYLAGWGYEWYKNGMPNIVELRNFIHEIASAPWVAVVGFIGKALVDKNKDGVPDEFEDEGTKDNEKRY